LHSTEQSKRSVVYSDEVLQNTRYRARASRCVIPKGMNLPTTALPSEQPQPPTQPQRTQNRETPKPRAHWPRWTSRRLEARVARRGISGAGTTLALFPTRADSGAPRYVQGGGHRPTIPSRVFSASEMRSRERDPGGTTPIFFFGLIISARSSWMGCMSRFRQARSASHFIPRQRRNPHLPGFRLEQCLRTERSWNSNTKVTKIL
jgi:hypothetical protein